MTKFTNTVELNGVSVEEYPMGGYLANYCPFCGSDKLCAEGSGQRCEGECGQMFWID